MHFIEPPQPSDRVVAAEIDGQLTTDDMKAVVARLQPIIDRGEKAFLYIDMQKYEGFEFGVVSEKLKHIGMLWRAFDKYATVGTKRWMEIWVKIVDPLTPQQIRHFSPDETHEASAWLLDGEGDRPGEA